MIDSGKEMMELADALQKCPRHDIFDLYPNVCLWQHSRKEVLDVEGRTRTRTDTHLHTHTHTHTHTHPHTLEALKKIVGII